ncbi:MAG TPA: glycosyltransferase [Actinomycetota bacterium]|nr:glycosyltransferase [Actinomycetota bacterium]
MLRWHVFMGRILIVSSLWPPVVLGGAETYASQLAEQLRAQGNDVKVLTFGVDGPDVVAKVPPWPYRLETYASKDAASRAAFHLLDVYRPETRRTIRRAIAIFRPDVVHTHAVSGLSSAAVAIPDRDRVGHVHTIHDYWLLCQRASLVKRSGETCETRCLSCRAISTIRNEIIRRHPPDVVLAVSNAVAEEHQDLDWLRGRLRVVPNPVVRTSREQPSAGPVVFGFLGRLTRDKGIATLVHAFEDAGLPGGTRLVVGGDGPLRDGLEARASANVELLGWLDAAARERFYDRIDALVVPSEWKDPAPLVVNEARARNIPIIGARIGGIPELIAPSSRQFLFRPGDKTELSERLLGFTKRDPDVSVDSGEGLLTWDEHLKQVADAYETARASASRR